MIVVYFCMGLKIIDPFYAQIDVADSVVVVGVGVVQSRIMGVNIWSYFSNGSPLMWNPRFW